MKSPFLVAAMAILLGCPQGQPVNAAQTPAFPEVFEAVKGNLPGAMEPELNEAAVRGFIARLGPRVTMVEEGSMASSSSITQTNMFEDAIAYIRIAQVQTGLAEQVSKHLAGLNPARRVKGVVLDLRYAGGTDYDAAARLIELFLSQPKPLLDWGLGVYKSRENPDAIKLPLVVLVNGKTSAAAEAVAAVARETATGLIIGNTTAGTAWRYKDVLLSNGRRLRIAQGTVALGSGAALPATGVKPDISVSVPEADELAYFADPYKLLASATPSSTNATRRVEMNEAELVRSRRMGPDAEPPRRNPAPEPRQLRDPVLSRAVDVLKGLAIVWQSRS